MPVWGQKKTNPQSEAADSDIGPCLHYMLHAHVEFWDGTSEGKIKSRSKRNSGKAKRAGLIYLFFPTSLWYSWAQLLPIVFAGYAPTHYWECKKRNPYLTSG